MDTIGLLAGSVVRLKQVSRAPAEFGRAAVVVGRNSTMSKEHGPSAYRTADAVSADECFLGSTLRHVLDVPSGSFWQPLNRVIAYH